MRKIYLKKKAFELEIKVGLWRVIAELNYIYIYLL